MSTNEKFKTTIGGQALIEGILMRGPKKDAIVVRGKEGLKVEVTDRKFRSKKNPLTWPFIRGAITFFDSQVLGTKAIMRSADLSPDTAEEEQKQSKFDAWLERKLGNAGFQKAVIGIAVALGLLMSIGLFFLLPMLVSSFFDELIPNVFLLHLLEGGVRIVILIGYMYLASKMAEMKRVFAYHGAEHKTIRCYEAGLELTVDNVRKQSCKHPRCGTSFLLVVVVLSILVFSAASSLLLELAPGLAAMKGTFLYRLIMIGFKLLLLPFVVCVTYEINRFLGRHDNWFTRILMAPGLWLQNITTNEPDDEMMEVGIEALKAVLPETEGEDKW